MYMYQDTDIYPRQPTAIKHKIEIIANSSLNVCTLQIGEMNEIENKSLRPCPIQENKQNASCN